MIIDRTEWASDLDVIFHYATFLVDESESSSFQVPGLFP